MEPSIVIRDHKSLEELQEAQRFASDSILKMVAHVSDFLDSLMASMQEQKKVLEEQVAEARERLEQAENAYSSCLSSQRYDEEDHCYRPSCDSEAAYVDCCQEEYDELKDRDDQAERVLSECDSELSKYRDPGGPLHPPGGEELMKYLAQDHTDKANEKMDEIRECAADYLSVQCSISSARLQRNAKQARLYENGVKQQEEKAEEEEKQTKIDKAKAFHAATISMQQEMSRKGYRDANAVAICPGCKRPINVCICQHIMERSR